jgi:hypothetical protein
VLPTLWLLVERHAGALTAPAERADAAG